MHLDDLIDLVAAATLPPAPTAMVPPNPELVAHIDGDGLAYYAAGNDNMPAGYVRSRVRRRVERLKRVTGATTVVMHLTCPSSHKGERFLIAESRPYQGNRKSKKKMKNWQAARNFLTEHDGSEFIPKLWTSREADDGMAYCSYATYDRKGLQVIHADDKDMRMFPGIHVNWRTWHHTVVPRGAFEVIGDDGLLYGHKWFWTQMITGDTADYIPGLPDQGPAAAATCLAQAHDNASAYAAVAALYARRMGEGWERYMCEQAALLWMRTGRSADVLEFLDLGVFPQHVLEAAWHLADRVQEKRRALEALNQ